MEEKDQELKWRRTAIRLILKGLRRCDILKQLPHGREWLRKWWHRFEQLGWDGLNNQARTPQHSPQAFDKPSRAVVLRVRRALERRQIGLIGAKAVRQEIIRQHLLNEVPSLATIKRWLHEAGLTHAAAPVLPNAYYPQPDWLIGKVLHACDWLARYLEGGEKVFIFHTIDARTRAVSQTISTNKTTATVRQHLLRTWHTLGLPHHLQLDNDAAFNGGERTARRCGAIVRLCLYLGIEIIFVPPGEPNRNGVVERVNGLWASQFWDRHHFSSLAHVLRKQTVFTDWYAHDYYPPALDGLTPAQMHRRVPKLKLSRQQIRAMPDSLPITAGRIHFVRRVAGDGTISFLGESWKVGRGLAYQYVWATVITHCRRLEIYHQRSERAAWRMVKTVDYELEETVSRLRPEYKR